MAIIIYIYFYVSDACMPLDPLLNGHYEFIDEDTIKFVCDDGHNMVHNHGDSWNFESSCTPGNDIKWSHSKPGCVLGKDQIDNQVRIFILFLYKWHICFESLH